MRPTVRKDGGGSVCGGGRKQMDMGRKERGWKKRGSKSEDGG